MYILCVFIWIYTGLIEESIFFKGLGELLLDYAIDYSGLKPLKFHCKINYI